MSDAPQKPTARDRLSLSLGANIFEVELLRDQVDALNAQLAERDATIAHLLAAMKPAEPAPPKA